MIIVFLVILKQKHKNMVHKCNKIGCSAEFKWPVQLHRHKKKCRHPERQKLILYTKDGNMFVRSAKRNFHSSQMQLDM